MEKIGIIDVGLGNVTAVKRMVQKVGGEPISVTQPNKLSEVTKFILPGVGHFNEGMRRLNRDGLNTAIKDAAKNEEIKILGICLGMQLLCRSSEEASVDGLGIVKAKVVKLGAASTDKIKVPHMGWNTVHLNQSSPLFSNSDQEKRFYFVHSYKVVPDEMNTVIAVTNYGSDFCSAYQQSNVFGVQFHPEKSHRFGMDLISRFVRL